MSVLTKTHYATPARRMEAGFRQGGWLKSKCGRWWRAHHKTTTDESDVTCGSCLQVLDDEKAVRLQARRKRALERTKNQLQFHCPYCDSRRIYRVRALTAVEGKGSILYFMLCEVCGHRCKTAHPKAVDQLAPAEPSGDVDVQELIDDTEK